MTTRLTSFTTTHGMIMRIHDNTTVVRTTAQPAAAASLTRALQCMVGVAYAADCGLAGAQNLAGLARGQFDDKQIIDTQEKPIGDKLSQPTFGVIQEYFHNDGIQAKTNNHKS